MNDISSVESSDGPFVQVITSLNDIAKQTGELISPLQTLDNSVKHVQSIVTDVDNLFTAMADVCKGIDYTRDICLALTAIPVVGEIADTAASVLSDAGKLAGTLKSDLQPVKTDVDTAKKELDKVQNGLENLLGIANDVATDIPTYTNTVMILNCLMEIAEPLAKVLKGNEAGDRLSAVLTDYETVKTDVSKAVLPLAEALDNILTSTNEFVKIVEDAINIVETGGVLKAAISGVRSVDSVLSPISDAMSKVSSAIAPVKWALDAVSCIFDKVFKPVIDEVLKETRLKSLVDGLKKKLENALGISAAIDALKKAFNIEKICQFAADFVPKASEVGTLSASLNTSLGKYSQNNNEGTKEAITGLVYAIVGTEIDPSKPSSIPDWPDAPSFNTPNQNSVSRLHTNYSGRMDAAKKALGSITVSLSSAVLTSGRSVSPFNIPPLGVADADWQGVDNLKTAVAVAIKELQAMEVDAATLETNLSHFQTSLQIPSTFSLQIADLEVMLKTSSDLFAFIAGLRIFESSLKPVSDVLQNQNTACTTVSSSMPQLAAAVTAISKSVEPVIAHVPSSSVIDTAIKTMTGWIDGADSLARLVDCGVVPNMTAEQKAKIAASREATNNNATALISSTVNAITASAKAIETSIKGINKELGSYATALTLVTQHDTLISERALPTANKVAKYMKTLDSIFDPLSELLNLTGCADPADPMKLGANTALTVINDTAKTTGSTLSDELAKLLEGIAEKILPLGQLNTDVINATATLTTNVQDSMANNCSGLVTSLDALTELLEDKNKCDYTNRKGDKESSPNQFVDAQEAATAQVLLETYN